MHIRHLGHLGQEEYSAMRDQWMHASEAAIVLCSVTSRHSFESASIFVDQFKRIKGVFNSDSFTICIVGSKTDCLNERGVECARLCFRSHAWLYIFRMLCITKQRQRSRADFCRRGATATEMPGATTETGHCRSARSNHIR